MNRFLLFFLMCVAATSVNAVVVESDFEDVNPAFADFYNGVDLDGGFHSGWAHFNTVYNTNWFSWSGIAASGVMDTNTAGWFNQYAVWTPGRGVNGSARYAVVFDFGRDDVITFAVPSCVRGLFVNNTTYAALAMLHGEFPAKKFGGADGNDPDWFKLDISAYDSDGAALGSVPFYLADYRASSNALDYVIHDWTWVDLSSLGGNVSTLHFALSSSDSGIFGMNTPAYFAFDGLQIVPKPNRDVVVDFEDVTLQPTGFWNGKSLRGGAISHGVHFKNSFDSLYGSWGGFAVSARNDTATAGWLNQYAVYTPGTGVGGGAYGIGFDTDWGGEQDIITFASAVLPEGFFVNNTTYAALSMLHGESPAKKFGGASGNDPDWFKLTISGKDGAGVVVGQKDFYLADYRFTDSALDYVVRDWTWVDLRGLGPRVRSLHFALSSTDNGAYGMNTPSYFAMDDLRFRYSFSAAERDPNLFDAPVPGFVGRAGDGVVGGGNTLNAAFAGWASSVVDYAPVPGLAAEWTDPTKALGHVSGDQTHVTSLGDPSSAQLDAGIPAGTLSLRTSTRVADEAGPDLVVFENALQNSGGVFADLAFVEVSSDGVNFARFPAVSLVPTNVTTYQTVRAEHAYNLIGKHANGYEKSWGTPFDLADLACHGLVQSGVVNLAAIAFVRIVDVPGRGHVFDTSVPPRPIFDPWPTVLSGGADVDAVAVINSPDFARVATSVEGPGYITPYGMPAGVVAVPNGSNVVFTIVPASGYHVMDVLVNGVSIGATNEYRFTSVQQDQRLVARFGSRLTVQSMYASAAPFVGSRILPLGPVEVALTSPMVSLGATQYVGVGWVGQGSAPPSGSGVRTGAFALTNDSVVTWLWQTNYWMGLSATRGGRVVSASSGWYAAGRSLAPEARPDAYYGFAGWSGDVVGATNAAVLHVLADRGRQMRANFWAAEATNAVPVAWLEDQVHTNDTPDARALSDLDGDGHAAWAEFQAGTDPNSASSVFAVVDFGFAMGSNYVVWLGGTNGSTRPFIIESCLRIGGEWTTLADGVGRSDDSRNVFWLPRAETNAFYRIRVSD